MSPEEALLEEMTSTKTNYRLKGQGRKEHQGSYRLEREKVFHKHVRLALEPLVTKFPGLRIFDSGEFLKVGNTKGDIVLRRGDKLVILELKTKLDQAALQQAFGRAYLMKRKEPKALFLLVAFKSAYREEIAQIFKSKVSGMVMLDEIYGMREGDIAATGGLSRMLERIQEYLTPTSDSGH